MSLMEMQRCVVRGVSFGYEDLCMIMIDDETKHEYHGY